MAMSASLTVNGFPLIYVTELYLEYISIPGPIADCARSVGAM